MKHLIATFFLSLSSCAVFAQDEIERMPASGLELTEQEIAYAKEMASLSVPEPMLYGGRPIEPGELPISVNLGHCTATILGKETIITAGHCNNSGSRIAFSFAGNRYSGACTRHPQYNDRTLLNDYTLCKFSPKADFPFYASLKPVPVAVGDIMTMQGYGRGSTGGKLHVGKQPIARILEQAGEIWTEGSVIYGSGDSGGSNYLNIKDLKTGPFTVISITSRAGSNLSISNMTGDARAQSFFKDWVAKNSVEVCGINWDCQGDVVPPPPPPPPVPGHCVEEQSFVKLAEAKLKLFKDMLAGCK